LIATSNINFSTNTGATSKYDVETIGVDPRLEVGVTKLESTFVSGNLAQLYQNTIVLGAHVADNLGVGPGKYVIVKILGDDGAYHVKRLLVIGISRHPGFSGFDDSAIININTMRAMRAMQNGHSTSFIIKLNDYGAAETVKEWVQARFPKLTVQTLDEAARAFLASINQVVVFINIVGYAGMAASALGVITILTMMVTGKTRDVGLLRAIGIQRLQILQIFITDGAIIGGIGAAAGGIAGTLITLYLQSSHAPIFGDFPLQVTFTPNLLIFPTAIGFLISIVSALYPAWKAASYKPVEAMRYF
jgi:ABC-type lipoprotein release transport system permease subunit